MRRFEEGRQPGHKVKKEKTYKGEKKNKDTFIRVKVQNGI